MTSFIIFSGNEPLALTKLSELCTIYSIDELDRTFIIPEKETSLGIEIIKKLQGKAMLKPFKGENKAVIISKSELLTIPAQNALLKLLEEPPRNTYIFLLSTNMEVFLPTIISRCQVIKVDEQPILADNERHLLANQLLSWQRLSIGDALKTAEKLAKDKEKTLLLLKNLMMLGSKKLKIDSVEKDEVIIIAEQLKHIQQTYRLLNTTNTNPRLALEDLLLSFQSTTA